MMLRFSGLDKDWPTGQPVWVYSEQVAATRPHTTTDSGGVDIVMNGGAVISVCGMAQHIATIIALAKQGVSTEGFV